MPPGSACGHRELTVVGGTVNFNNGGTSNNQTVASLSGSGGIITNSDTVNVRTFTVNQATATSFGGGINGTLQLVKANSGTLTLQGNSNYSGGTLITGGVVSIFTDNTTGPAQLGLVPTVAAAGSLTLNGGALAATSSFALAPTRGIALGSAGGSIDVAPGNTLTYNGLIADAPAQSQRRHSISLTAASLISGSANTYSGGTTVSAGTLGVANATGSATGSGTSYCRGRRNARRNGATSPGPVSIAGNLAPGLGAREHRHPAPWGDRSEHGQHAQLRFDRSGQFRHDRHRRGADLGQQFNRQHQRGVRFQSSVHTTS